MSRSNILFSTSHQIRANEFIENASGVTTDLPFDANTNYKVHVKSLTESSGSAISFNKSTSTLVCSEIIED